MSMLLVAVQIRPQPIKCHWRLAYLSSPAAGPCPKHRTKELSWWRHVLRPKHSMAGDHLRRYSGVHQSEFTHYLWFLRLWLIDQRLFYENRRIVICWTFIKKTQKARSGFSLLPYVDGIAIEANKKHVGTMLLPICHHCWPYLFHSVMEIYHVLECVKFWKLVFSYW